MQVWCTCTLTGGLKCVVPESYNLLSTFLGENVKIPFNFLRKFTRVQLILPATFQRLITLRCRILFFYLKSHDFDMYMVSNIFKLKDDLFIKILV